MLRWLLILAMAVLPWHGWAGAGLPAPAAAAQHQEVRAVNVLAAPGHGSHHGQAGADCLDEVEAAAGHHAVVDANGGCPGCSMCHSCSPAGLPAMAGVPPADAMARQHPAIGEIRFASADRDAGLKPPIS